MSETTAQLMARICRRVGVATILPVRGATEPAIFYREVADRVGVSWHGATGRALSKAGICIAVTSEAGLDWLPDWDGRLTPSGGGGSVTNDGLRCLEEAVEILLERRRLRVVPAQGQPVLSQGESASRVPGEHDAPVGAEYPSQEHGPSGSGAVAETLTLFGSTQPIAYELKTEAVDMVKILKRLLGVTWDGRASIEQMRSRGSTNWRQMEWPGFFFEETGRAMLQDELGGGRSRRFGQTVFDYENRRVWDLKAHTIGSGRGECILNDAEAMRRCMNDTGSVGVVILEGHADYDEDGSFKAWHDALKGPATAYEIERVERGAPSRRRKVRFTPVRLLAVAFNGDADLVDGIADGWLDIGFQQGMRNEGGGARRSKATLRPAAIPASRILAEATTDLL